LFIKLNVALRRGLDPLENVSVASPNCHRCVCYVPATASLSSYLSLPMTSVVSIDFRMSPELRVNLSSPSWAGVTSNSTSFGAAVSAAESVVVDRRWDAVVASVVA